MEEYTKVWGGSLWQWTEVLGWKPRLSNLLIIKERLHQRCMKKYLEIKYISRISIEIT